VEFPKGGDAHDIAIVLDETENIAVRSVRSAYILVQLPQMRLLP